MKIEIEIPEGKKAEWVNGVLTLVDDKPIEYKFKVGDKVIYPLFSKDKAMTITEQLTVNGCPCYNLKSYNNIYIRGEEDEILPYISQDITERIKTFEDAYKWCRGNGNIFLCSQYERILELSLISIDLLAYLKLRIITCALNEGWEPTFDLDEPRWLVKTEGDEIRICYEQGYNNTFVSGRMFFKTGKLAQYAAEQFRDIYADFCGIKKGGEK